MSKYVFAALVVLGYEYHDDYIETARYSIEITLDMPSFAEADMAITGVCRELVGGFDGDGWWRIESIERVY